MKNRPTGKPSPRSRGPFGERDSRGGDRAGRGKPARTEARGGKTPYGERGQKPYGATKTEDKPRSDRPFRGKDSAERKPQGAARRIEEKSWGKSAPSRPTGKPAGKSAPWGGKARGSARPVRAAEPVTQPAVREKPAALRGQVLWGAHAVREAWLNPDRKIIGLTVSESGMAIMAPVLEEAEKLGLVRPAPRRAERSEIDARLPRGTVHQGLMMEAEPLRELSLDDLLGQDSCPELVVVLDQVTDPHNVGAILRSAAAFGAGAVIVTERNAPSTTGILAKTACGAAEHVPLIAVVNLARALEALKAESFWCVGLAEEGEHDLCEARLGSGRIALVMGAEGDGMRRLTREHCDEIARLPTGGAIGSLNVSNAAAVSLYEVRRQKGKGN